jgi:flagellar biosynthetic protein FliS
MNNAAKIYERTRISTSSNPRIIYMLHCKCVQLIQQSLEDVEHRTMLIRAQNIIAELEHALIIEDELSQGLFYIYDYCYCLLETDNLLHKQHAISTLCILRDTFGQLLKEP